MAEKKMNIVVVPSNSSSTNYDVKCDGVNDCAILKEQIRALAEGGTLVLGEGTFNLDETLTVSRDNITIIGISQDVVLKRKFNGGILVMFTSLGGVIENLTIDNSLVSGDNETEENTGLIVGSNSIARSIWVANTANSGSYPCYAIQVIGPNVTVENCTIQNLGGTSNYAYGIYVSARDSKIINNRCENGGVSKDSSLYGIYVDEDAPRCRIEGNVITGLTSTQSAIAIQINSIENQVIGNVVGQISSYTEAGSTSTHAARGIDVTATGKNNEIIGNTCSDAKTYGDSINGGNNIYINGDNNYISGNVCRYTPVNNEGLLMQHRNILIRAQHNRALGNDCMVGSGSAADYGTLYENIRILDKYNIVNGNNVWGQDVRDNYYDSKENLVANNNYSTSQMDPSDGISEAPSDGKQYIRKNKEWSSIKPLTFTGAVNETYDGSNSLTVNIPIGKKPCRFVVGSTGSGYTADDVDYLCDGTADEVEINAAIAALPENGGEVRLLDGVYNVSSNIVLSHDNVILSGQGKNTKIVRNFGETYDTTSGVIRVYKNSCTVQDLYINGYYGVDYNYQSGTSISCGGNNNRFLRIEINGCSASENGGCIGILVSGTGNLVEDCLLDGVSGGYSETYGLKMSGNYNRAINNRIVSNIGWNNSYALHMSGEYCSIESNECSGFKANGTYELTSGYGIYVSCNNSIIANNKCHNVAAEQGNVYGFYVTGNANITTGNISANLASATGQVYGIYLTGNTNTVDSNAVCYANALSANEFTIYLASTAKNNIVCGNNIMGKNVVDGNTDITNKNYKANNKYSNTQEDSFVEEAPSDGSGYARKNGAWGALASVATSGLYSDLVEKPTTMKNPNALTFTGAATGTYDGSNAMTVNIPAGSGDGIVRYVIGTSAAGHSASDVDYLCDGVNDEVQINAAITALPSEGGIVQLLAGTYQIQGAILINKNKVTLVGEGTNTILNRNFVGETITLSARNCMINQFSLQNDENLTLTDCTVHLTGSRNTIRNIDIQIGSSTEASGCNGFLIEGYGDNIVCDNTISIQQFMSEYAIKVVNNSSTIISGNNIIVMSDYVDCYALYITGGSRNTVTGNELYGGSAGVGGGAIWLGSNNCSVFNNSLTATGYSNNLYGIHISGQKNLVMANFYNNPDTGGSAVAYAIYISGEQNLIENNQVSYSYDIDEAYGQHTIYMASSSKKNFVLGNLTYGKDVEDFGTNNSATNNKYN